MDFSAMTRVEMINYFESVKKHASELFEKTEPEQFNRKPSLKSWSAAECVEHLNVAARGYLKNIPPLSREIKVEEENKKKYIPRFIAKKFIEITGPDAKIKLKSVGSRSTQINLPKSTLAEFLSHQDQFIAIAAKTEFDQFRDVKVKSPFVPVLKFQLGEDIMMTIGHQMRHLNQAEKALNKN